MKATIDKAGRLVIPRSLRDRIGLAGGGEVEIELDGAAIRIEPVAGRGLREDGGLLFIPQQPTRCRLDTDADQRPVALLDTSTAVALIVEDHEAHVATLDAVRGRRLGLAGHAWFETYWS